VPKISFNCPNCKAKLRFSVKSPITREDGVPTIRIKCREAICCSCTKGLRMIFCAAVEPLSEHDIRKDAKLYRIAEDVRRKRKVVL